MSIVGTGLEIPLLLLWLFGPEHGGLDLSHRPDAGPGPLPPPLPPRPPRAPTAPSTPAARPPVTAPASTVPASHVPAPFPQVVPAGLPPFPGPGWVPAEPPGAAVVARAMQLLPELWRAGEGAFKIELTAGKWIAYRATKMGPTTKGVVAFRERAPSVVTPPVDVEITPKIVPTPHGQTIPASVPSSPVGLRTLKLTSPRTKGTDVAALQRMLGILDDGEFGSGTHAAVVAFQRTHKDVHGNPLVPDGKVGPLTWGALAARA